MFMAAKTHGAGCQKFHSVGCADDFPHAPCFDLLASWFYQVQPVHVPLVLARDLNVLVSF